MTSAHNHYATAPGSADDAAIATDKSALLPGHTATFANYSSYSRGLNGLIIDVWGLPVSKLSHRRFRALARRVTTTPPSTWAVAQSHVQDRSASRPPGAGGSTRIVLIWSDHNAAGESACAIAGKWPQVCWCGCQHGSGCVRHLLFRKCHRFHRRQPAQRGGDKQRRGGNQGARVNSAGSDHQQLGREPKWKR